MICELPMSNQWNVTFRSTLPTDEQYGAKAGKLPASHEPRSRNAASHASQDKRAVA